MSRDGSARSRRPSFTTRGAATHAGEWDRAAAAGAEAARWARDTRQPQFGLTGELMAALASALRGNATGLEAIVAEPERTLLAMRAGPLLAPAHLARGAAALGEGRHEDAFRHLWPVFDEDAPAFQRFMRWPAVLDLVEAGGRGEHAARVTAVVGELEEIAERSEPPVLGAGLTCARPLMAPERGRRGAVHRGAATRPERAPVLPGADIVLVR